MSTHKNPPIVDYELAESVKGLAAGTTTAVTLRDVFAAVALAALIPSKDHSALSDAGVALAAYELADAMLAARQPFDATGGSGE